MVNDVAENIDFDGSNPVFSWRSGVVDFGVHIVIASPWTKLLFSDPPRRQTWIYDYLRL
jgi:hypothetical protein